MSEPLAEADRRIENLIRVGRVVSVDAGTARAVVDFGDLHSPLLPVGQIRAGQLQFWWMPGEGEQVLVACESGDIAQGVIVASLYASNACSSDGSTPQIDLKGGQMILNGSLRVTGDVIVEGDVIAQGVSLVTHTHKDVMSGNSNTGAPNR
ncbi:phage baseplate assembly protein V [Palleronia caenipelagi]|nr:phage baseplate assembly protein V [Palleronia caenipelagi]